MGGERLTAAQRRALLALSDSPGATASRLADLAGYQGRSGTAHGGTGRAPQWWGRFVLLMPPGLVRRYYVGRSTRYELTEKGRAALASETSHGG